MSKLVNLSDEVIAQLDRMKRDRSYSEVIKELLSAFHTTEQDRINKAFFDLRSSIALILGDEMGEVIEFLRVIVIRCYRYRTDKEFLSEQINVISSALQGALEEIYRLSDQR